ncbi:hypothetical protein E2I00_016136, partial [Balaenoptera physalus]
TTFQGRGFGNTVRLYTYSQAAKEQTNISTKLLGVITVSKGSTMTAYGDRNGKAVRSLCEIPAANECLNVYLGAQGCTKGRHDSEKPPEPVKPEVKTTEKKELSELKPKFQEHIIQAPKPIEAIKRPSPDEPMTNLELKISASLKQALDKLKLSSGNEENKKEDDSDEIKIGTSCKNGGCSKTYQGPQSLEEVCVYHSGVPIFHEGMKYWSCCRRKTSDFNTFLAQEGCTTGKHTWTKKDAGKKVVPCRHDWHQTGGEVTISVYAKNSLPELSQVVANSTLLNVHIVFEGEKEFHQNVKLWGWNTI